MATEDAQMGEEVLSTCALIHRDENDVGEMAKRGNGALGRTAPTVVPNGRVFQLVTAFSVDLDIELVLLSLSAETVDGAGTPVGQNGAVILAAGQRLVITPPHRVR